MGSDESHFNVSVGSDGQSHKTVSTNHKRKESRSGIEPRSFRLPLYQPNTLPLGQTGSRGRTTRVSPFKVRTISCFSSPNATGSKSLGRGGGGRQKDRYMIFNAQSVNHDGYIRAKGTRWSLSEFRSRVKDGVDVPDFPSLVRPVWTDNYTKGRRDQTR